MRWESRRVSLLPEKQSLSMFGLTPEKEGWLFSRSCFSGGGEFYNGRSGHIMNSKIKSKTRQSLSFLGFTSERVQYGSSAHEKVKQDVNL